MYLLTGILMFVILSFARLLRFGGYWKSNRFVHWNDMFINTANIIGRCNCYFNHYCNARFIIEVEEETVKRILFWLKRKERLQKRKCSKCCFLRVL